MDAQELIARLTETPASPKVIDDADIDTIAVLRTVLGIAPKVTVLPMGATRRVPDGYRSEAAYLAASRWPEPMRCRDTAGRQSHRRWLGETTTVGEILERHDKSWRGNGAARRQYARAQAARMWYGVPNIILGQ